ncbi:glucuronate isomerase [Corticicoccus populi]|uniref:Uronate isomerase n=1 Tax=Corticicoccus populi TaxID=1812821 RepID=A0ABW5WUL9_9STAP
MPLIHEDFLLTTEKAKTLYRHVKDLPVYDFHCHLSPKEIYEDMNFPNITDLWLRHDHYKWRLMRAYGIEESMITGDGCDYEKFEAFTKVIPKSMTNPMYHWCYLELARYFNHFEGVQHTSPEVLYNYLNKVLESEEMTPRNILKKSRVKVVCTTDDPCDDLYYHKELRKDPSFDIAVRPTFRPDAYITLNEMEIEGTVGRLEEAAGKTIDTLEDYIEALLLRAAYFNDNGARSADHSFGEVFHISLNDSEAAECFSRLRAGGTPDRHTLQGLTGYLFTALQKRYVEYGWVTQLHLGPLRNNNTGKFNSIGRDAGFDSLGNLLDADKLNELLDALDKNDALGDTIIYPHNANDHQMVLSAAGNFTSSERKVQIGAAWWYNDTKTGMIEHLIDYGNMSLLPEFIGMVTDSRSLLSYSRHEYFRRILCEYLGGCVERGEIEDDDVLLKEVLEDICFNNAEKLFKIIHQEK